MIQTFDGYTYVVCDEHTLGYLINNGLDVRVVEAHQTKGAPFELYPHIKLVGLYSNIRIANNNDFDNFRVCLPPGATTN
jgi:hypothetical protein